MSDPQQPPYAPQPDQSASPYGQPSGYPAGTGFSTPGYGAAPAVMSTLGRTAFIIAVITAGIGLLFTLANPFLIPTMTGSYAVYDLVSLARSILGGALGALALILGIIAARRRAQPVRAGIAIGVGAGEILGLLSWLFVSVMYTVI